MTFFPEKGSVINAQPQPMTHGTTTIHITSDQKPPGYMANNLNQQSGMSQPNNLTYNSMAQPVNNTNFSSNIDQNSNQILPVLPPSTNPQFVNPSYQAF